MNDHSFFYIIVAVRFFLCLFVCLFNSCSTEVGMSVFFIHYVYLGCTCQVSGGLIRFEKVVKYQ